MKKLLAIILSILIIIPSSIALASDDYTSPIDEITKEEAYQFADELKAMNLEEYDVTNRLIVSADKDIDYMDAIDVATGIEGLYVLQFPNAETADEAYSYYDSLSYVNYVEYDVECENSLCSIDSENINLQNTYTKNDFDFIPDCPSTVNQNIDDAIKLLKRENIEMPEIRVGVIDSGISKTKITEDVLEDGYSFLEGYSENGTDDRYGHGTKVAGTIIINSIDNIKLLPFQVYDSSGCSNLSNVVTAIYLGVSENCKILNCSIGIKTAVSSTKNAFEEAVNYAVSQGCICVASAGNDNINLSETNQLPASVKNSIAVGAITQKKKITSFSNFGDGVDIYAIGSNMLSYDNNGTKVTNWLGTSAATPVISSICALLITAKPDITVDEIKQLLIETGYSFNEENQSDKDRIIADAYG
ncbi:MAG: S8 family serine peptidase, partial [Eubacterium sp.]|nr:S8 family serine peptidase [Eubacterium sp.]